MSIFGGDAAIHFACGRIAWDDRRGLPVNLLGVGFGVQTEIHFAIGLVGTVTQEASIGKNGPDVAAELDRRSLTRSDPQEG